jgi:hypothetical protein
MRLLMSGSRQSAFSNCQIFQTTNGLNIVFTLIGGGQKTKNPVKTCITKKRGTVRSEIIPSLCAAMGFWSANR